MHLEFVSFILFILTETKISKSNLLPLSHDILQLLTCLWLTILNCYLTGSTFNSWHHHHHRHILTYFFNCQLTHNWHHQYLTLLTCSHVRLTRDTQILSNKIFDVKTSCPTFNQSEPITNDYFFYGTFQFCQHQYLDFIGFSISVPFWLQTVVRYHKLSFYYSIHHSVLRDEPSAPMLQKYIYSVLYSNTLFYWGVYSEYIYTILLHYMYFMINWSLAHRQTPSPAKMFF